MKKKIFSLLVLLVAAVTGAWAVDYNLTVGENAHGTITFKVGDETVTTAQEGQTVTMTITPAEGWVVNQPSGQWYAAIAASRRVAPQNIDLLDAVTLTPAGENTWTFTMQRANVEISSTYKKLLTNADITILDIQAPTYSGQALEPAVTVKDGSAVLVKDVDYTVTYSNNTDAALATATEKAPTVTVTAVATSEKYAGETTKTFTIQPKALASDLIAAIDALTYSGQALEPQPVVTYNDMTLEKGKDYSVTYADNVNAGTATLTVTAAQNPNYSGSATKDFTVQKKSLEAGFIAAIDALIYTGQAQTPEPVVTYNDMTLEKGKDYSVAYADNVNPGTATVTVTAAAECNYSGTASKTFTIQKKEVEAGFIADIEAVTYSGQAQTPDPAITFNDMTLVKGTDYLIGYTNNVNAGTATVTVTGIGFYSGNASKTFTIQKKALTVTADDKEVTYGDDAPEYTVTYDGFVNGETAAVLGGTLALDCSYVKNESGAGVYIIRPSGLTSGNYAITNNTGKLTVGKKVLEDSFVADIDDVAYTGQAQKPAPVVTFHGMTLAANTDYSVTYANNKNAGTATMTVTGKGDYSGTVTKEFTITKVALTVTAEDKSVAFGANAPKFTAAYDGFVNSESMGVLGGTLTFDCPYVKGQSGVGEYAITPGGLTSDNYDITFVDGKLTVEQKALANSNVAAIEAQTYTGEALEPAPVVTFNGMTLAKGTDYTVEYASNVNAGTAKVTVTGMGNYSGAVTKNFTIKAAELTAATLEETNLVYNGLKQTVQVASVTAGTLEVPAGSYNVAGNEGTEVGNYTVTVTGKGNYRGSVTAQFSIVHGDANTFELTLDPTEFVYDGQEKKPAVTVKDGTVVLKEDTDYTLVYENNVNAGTAKVTATGIGSYSGTKTAEFTIKKADATLTAPVAKTDLVYTGEAQELVTAGQAEGGTIAYSLDNENWSAEIPAATAAGAYKVYYKVTVDANHNDVEGAFVEVTIAKADVTLTAPVAKTDLVYSDEAQELIVAGQAEGGTIAYSLDGENWSDAIPAATAAGTYKVYYKVTGDANHNDVEAAFIEVTIAAPENTIPVMTEDDPVSTVDGETFYHLGQDEKTTEFVGSLVDTEDAGQFIQNLGLSSNAQERIIPTETGMKATEGENIRIILKDMPADHTLTIDFTGKMRMLKGALTAKEAGARRAGSGQDMELADDQGYSITESGDVIIELETLEGPVVIHKITVTKETPTGISAVADGQKTAGTYYDLNGRKIANGQKPTAKGVYILNGKKVVIK